MSLSIGLVGNPNCGKTTMFNQLTGNLQYVGNWPGVTVEKKEGTIKNKDGNINLVDLPGIYSLSPYTLEEIVTRDYIIKEKPNVIINIVDASNIERNLYLTTQILEMGIPTVIALNMIDIVNKRGEKIDINKLSNIIGCPIVETSALKGTGLKEVIEKAYELSKSSSCKYLDLFSKNLEEALTNISEIINVSELDRWYSIKVFEKDEKVLKELSLSTEKQAEINQIIKDTQTYFDDESESIIINERYNYITEIVKSCVEKNPELYTSNKIDKIVTNKYLGLPIFAGIIFVIYYVAITLGSVVTDWTNDVLLGGYFAGFIQSALDSLNVSDWLNSLVMDGIVNGVFAVLGFLPQMAILFFFMSLLEDCGYMARIAFIMDRIFRKVGLSGKSVIPMLISTGCGVPGVMSSRTIENESSRKITVMTTTFMPCSAKLPIITLFVSSLFPQNVLIGPSIYFLSIFMVLISGLILKKFKAFKSDETPFIMELPNYHLPSAKNVVRHILDKVKSFIIKAGTVIFVTSIVLWILTQFTFSFTMTENPEESILASLGKIIAPIFAPLGFNNWQSAVATVNGLVAKEQLVSTFGVLLGLGEVAETDAQLIEKVSHMFTTVSAYSFVTFNMLCAPCFAAIGAIRREMVTWKWTFIAIGYQTLLAYLASFVIYNVGNFIVYREMSTLNIIYLIISILIIIGTLYLIFKPNRKDI